MYFLSRVLPLSVNTGIYFYQSPPPSLLIDNEDKSFFLKVPIDKTIKLSKLTINNKTFKCYQSYQECHFYHIQNICQPPVVAFYLHRAWRADIMYYIVWFFKVELPNKGITSARIDLSTTKRWESYIDACYSTKGKWSPKNQWNGAQAESIPSPAQGLNIWHGQASTGDTQRCGYNTWPLHCGRSTMYPVSPLPPNPHSLLANKENQFLIDHFSLPLHTGEVFFPQSRANLPIINTSISPNSHLIIKHKCAATGTLVSFLQPNPENFS